MINRQSIVHKTKSNYAYAFDGTTIHIWLRSKRNDLINVELLTDHESGWVPNDSGKWIWKKKKIKMVRKFSTNLYDYWFASYSPSSIKMRYGFLLNDEVEELLYIERGFFNPNDEYIENDINSYFAFPYLYETDVFRAPNWVKDTIWYQIFPDRFANSLIEKNPNKLIEWENKTKEIGEKTIVGGNLRGIINKLGYLKELGISGIYLTPIFLSPTSHKYDTMDYFEIDPHFGTKEDFRELVSKAHELGIRVMLDAVFNHIGFESFQFQDALRNGKKSKYYNWFYFTEEDYLNFSPHMPKLNTTNLEVKKYLFNVAKYWIEETDIDGWRLDVANEVDHQFWREFRTEIKSIKPEVYICGEIWHDSQAWLNGDQFDGVMNYPLSKPVQEWIATGRIDGVEFQEEFIHAYTRYPKNQQMGMMTLIDSHDTPRITTWANNDDRKVDMCFAFLSTIPGSICFYYGSEVYLEGGDDPDNRRPMLWSKIKRNATFKKILQLRDKYPEIGSAGEYEFLKVQKNSIIFTKKVNEEITYFIFNTKNKNSIQLPEEMCSKNYFDLLKSENVILDKHVSMEEYSYLILKEEGEK